MADVVTGTDDSLEETRICYWTCTFYDITWYARVGCSLLHRGSFSTKTINDSATRFYAGSQESQFLAFLSYLESAKIKSKNPLNGLGKNSLTQTKFNYNLTVRMSKVLCLELLCHRLCRLELVYG